MKLKLHLNESVEENAQRFFEAAKKARKKARGAEKAIARAQETAPSTSEKLSVKKARISRKEAWYESFRWSFSSDGFLMVGGRDAATNEALIKRHTEKQDLVFHSDMAGAPFIVVKSEGKTIPASTREEAAQFCASFSRAWRAGLGSLEVFFVLPEQVTKEAQAGEYLGKGAFMIRGKTNYLRAELQAAIGIDKEGRVMGGPPRAVKKHCTRFVLLLPGNRKASDVAKEIYQVLEGGTLDEIVAALPPGGLVVKK